MKTSEFIEKVEKLEFVSKVEEKAYGVFQNFDKCLIVRGKECEVISTVSIEDEFLIGTRFSSYIILNFKQRKQLFNLLTEYAATPIEQRKDKTIEERVCEYIQECLDDNLSFESARDFIEACSMYVEQSKDFDGSNFYKSEQIDEYAKIYDWYHANSNEFIKLWLEVSGNEH